MYPTSTLYIIILPIYSSVLQETEERKEREREEGGKDISS
jgi:hypothetical protein